SVCHSYSLLSLPFCVSSTPSLQCIENYTGARCEEVFLPSSSIQTKSDLFAAFVALIVLLGTLILGALYFLCRFQLVWIYCLWIAYHLTFSHLERVSVSQNSSRVLHGMLIACF
ncbi:hypothetical protein FD755_018997, partial [Muntiacus reevesi]